MITGHNTSMVKDEENHDIGPKVLKRRRDRGSVGKGVKILTFPRGVDAAERVVDADRLRGVKGAVVGERDGKRRRPPHLLVGVYVHAAALHGAGEDVAGAALRVDAEPLAVDGEANRGDGGYGMAAPEAVQGPSRLGPVGLRADPVEAELVSVYVRGEQQRAGGVKLQRPDRGGERLKHRDGLPRHQVRYLDDPALVLRG
mmetsp:Transcript_22940/g.64461  ORF Transcript_22940/g.64461 Transcript_22940/m.64461 type:complete len:200 (+) Transcript_22940:976-1575(+)